MLTAYLVSSSGATTLSIIPLSIKGLVVAIKMRHCIVTADMPSVIISLLR